MIDLVILTFTESGCGTGFTPGYLPSDLLWKELYSRDLQIQGAAMSVESPYRVSSAFPYFQGEWLLPRPHAAGEACIDDLEVVGFEDFAQLAQGTPLTDAQLEVAEARQWCARRPGRPTWPRDVQELCRAIRVSAPRLLGDDLHATTTAGPDGSGPACLPPVGFLLLTHNHEQRCRLIAALQLLAVAGLASQQDQGERFTFELIQPSRLLPALHESGGPSILLSRTCPTADEHLALALPILPAPSSSGPRLNGLECLEEGLRVPDSMTGQLVEMTLPECSTPAYWCGLAVSVAVQRLSGVP